MAILKITQKHHNRFNNPFLSAPKTLHIIQGSLLVNSKTVPSHEIYEIGNDFQLCWSSNNGGFLSISHLSQPSRPIWSSIPGQAFVSAALADTEVEESRGSYLVKDTDVHLVCNHQTIDDIRVINGCDHHLESEVVHSPSGYLGMNQKSDVKDTTTYLPTLLITGRLFNTMKKKNRRFQKQEVMHEYMQFKAKGPSAYARYWVLFSQKTKSQVGFQVKIEKPNFISRKQVSPSPTPSRIYRGFKKRVTNRKRRIGWCWSLSRPRGYVSVPSSAEEEMGKLKMPESTEFNRIWLTHASEKDERFYGFGEQFSHMNLKGKRVPIFVQEQGIGRGDQPITFAANLVSYRAGGDWSTTYAPSPFYMTSKMRSIYLEGYDYTIFDLTRHDRVQIQIHGNSVEGRILHGNSPCELIERFTETIGRQPELPEWIISGALVGMQGGTDVVRHIWDQLTTYDVPISAFWLQVIPHSLSPVCRHLFLHYPNDEYVLQLSYQQFLVGSEILVVH